MAGISLDAASMMGSEDTVNGGATGLPSTVTPVSFSVVSDEHNRLMIRSPQVLVDGKLVTLGDQLVSAGTSYYCNVTESGGVSISTGRGGKYSVPICAISYDGTVRQFHTGVLSVGGGGGGGGGGVQFIGTDKTTNWSGDDAPSAVCKFVSGNDSNVVVKVTGSNTFATVSIDVYYK